MDVYKNGEIRLYGTVGKGLLSSQDGFSAMDVTEALMRHGRKKDLTVRINSGGGFTSEGVSIYSQLREHGGKVTVVVESVAASAASLIAMAGDRIVMKKGSVMMIHDPSLITFGNSKAHKKSVEALEAQANSMAEIYADRAGKSVEEARADMEEEVWLTPQMAMEQGYADDKDDGRARKPTAFDYRLYTNAPDRMVALAETNDWELGAEAASDDAFDNDDEGDDDMTTDPNKGKGGAASDTAKEDKSIAGIVMKVLDTREAAAKEAADKAKADEEAAKAKSAGNETAEQMTARIRKEEQTRMAEVTAACSLAGKSEMAAKFIEDGKSVGEVVAELQKARGEGDDKGKTTSSNGKSDELNNRQTRQDVPSVSAETTSLWDKHTEKFNKSHGFVN